MAVTGDTTALIEHLKAEIEQHNADIKPLLVNFYEAHLSRDANKLNAADAALQNLYHSVLTKEQQIDGLKGIQTQHQVAKPDLIAWLRMTSWLH